MAPRSLGLLVAERGLSFLFQPVTLLTTPPPTTALGTQPRTVGALATALGLSACLRQLGLL